MAVLGSNDIGDDTSMYGDHISSHGLDLPTTSNAEVEEPAEDDEGAF